MFSYKGEGQWLFSTVLMLLENEFSLARLLLSSSQ